MRAPRGWARAARWGVGSGSGAQRLAPQRGHEVKVCGEEDVGVGVQYTLRLQPTQCQLGRERRHNLRYVEPAVGAHVEVTGAAAARLALLAARDAVIE